MSIINSLYRKFPSPSCEIILLYFSSVVYVLFRFIPLTDNFL